MWGTLLRLVSLTMVGGGPSADTNVFADELHNTTTILAEAVLPEVSTNISTCDDLATRAGATADSPFCQAIADHGLTEVEPGLAVGGDDSTVTVIADRTRVSYEAIDGPPVFAGDVAGDVVVNANWFTPEGSYGPVISSGRLSGSSDTRERGQIIRYQDGCGSESLVHLWTGEIFESDGCIETVVSGVSIVHNGRRSDAYTGYDLTDGYTNTSTSHSFIGFNQRHIIVITSTAMNSSQLADYALSLGVEEGVMLDGGGSTQIETPSTSITSTRPVPSFAILNSTD